MHQNWWPDSAWTHWPSRLPNWIWEAVGAPRDRDVRTEGRRGKPERVGNGKRREAKGAGL